MSLLHHSAGFPGGPQGSVGGFGASPQHASRDHPLPTPSWTETAYDWRERSNKKRREKDHPSDPASAAWRFLQANSSSAGGEGGGGTGVAFVDAVLRHRSPKQDCQDGGRRHRFPVLDIRGDAGCGKTWTVVTLAARFAAATVPSQFKPATQLQPHESPPTVVLPRVIVLDSLYDITATKLAYAVRSALLLRTDRPSDEDQLERDTECCCHRIHVATASRTTDWVAVLESIRNQLVAQAAAALPHDQHPPTLLLWDGFLDEPTNEAERTEVMRQLVRILHDCPVMFVSTASPSARRYEWEKHVTHRVRLQRDHHASSDASNQQRFVATLLGNRIPYSISLAGILS